MKWKLLEGGKWKMIFLRPMYALVDETLGIN